MDIDFKCPKCDQDLSADANDAGTEIECPACHETIIIPQSVGAEGQAETNAPLGSWKIVMRPWAGTSNGGMTTVPPAAATFFAVSSALAVPK